MFYQKFLLACVLLLSSSAQAFLTPSQQDAITDVIKNDLAPSLGDHGVKLFIKLFEVHPEYQSLFSKFANVAPADLEHSSVMRAHAINILKKFASCILDNLGSEEDMSACFLDVAAHHKAKRVGPDHVKVLGGVLMSYLQSVVPDKVNWDLESGMTKIFLLIIDAFQQEAF